MKRLVIFDGDVVLVDSERISHTVLQQLLAERGVLLSRAWRIFSADDVAQAKLAPALLR